MLQLPTSQKLLNMHKFARKVIKRISNKRGYARIAQVALPSSGPGPARKKRLNEENK